MGQQVHNLQKTAADSRITFNVAQHTKANTAEKQTLTRRSTLPRIHPHPVCYPSFNAGASFLPSHLSVTPGLSTFGSRDCELAQKSGLLSAMKSASVTFQCFLAAPSRKVLRTLASVNNGCELG